MNNKTTQIQKHIVKNHYIANPTLINIRQGNVVICNMDSLCCYAISEGVYFLKKGIKVGLSAISSQENPVLILIPIPEFILKSFCSGFSEIISKEDIARTPNNKDEWLIKAVDITYGKEVLRKIEHISKENSTLLQSTDIVYSFYYILSHFTANNTLPDVIRNSSENTLKERVYNIISNNLNTQWTLENMAKHLYMSPSSLKRKLQKEDATFSEICLSARMNAAVKLLQKKSAPAQEISKMCGYDNYSYFITVFKKYFNTTPRKYANALN